MRAVRRHRRRACRRCCAPCRTRIHAARQDAGGVIPRARRRRAGWSSRSAARWSSMSSRRRRARPGSPASRPTSPRCAARGTEVIVVSSGAIALARRALGSDPQAAAAGGEAGRRRGRPDPPRAGLGRGAVGARPDRRAVAADAGRHRGPPPLPQRARHARARCWRSAACRSSTRTTRVATAEIRFGDNDRLAARVAEMVQADQLVLLSDIDGLYTADPRARPGGARTSRWSQR